jgi:hypothetical protein
MRHLRTAPLTAAQSERVQELVLALDTKGRRHEFPETIRLAVAVTLRAFANVSAGSRWPPRPTLRPPRHGSWPPVKPAEPTGPRGTQKTPGEWCSATPTRCRHKPTCIAPSRPEVPFRSGYPALGSGERTPNNQAADWGATSEGGLRERPRHDRRATASPVAKAAPRGRGCGLTARSSSRRSEVLRLLHAHVPILVRYAHWAAPRLLVRPRRGPRWGSPSPRGRRTQARRWSPRR